MQQELEYLETDYEAKIEKLKNERIQIETSYKEEIQNLKVLEGLTFYNARFSRLSSIATNQSQLT